MNSSNLIFFIFSSSFSFYENMDFNITLITMHSITRFYVLFFLCFSFILSLIPRDTTGQPGRRDWTHLQRNQEEVKDTGKIPGERELRGNRSSKRYHTDPLSCPWEAGKAISVQIQKRGESSWWIRLSVGGRIQMRSWSLSHPRGSCFQVSWSVALTSKGGGRGREFCKKRRGKMCILEVLQAAKECLQEWVSCERKLRKENFLKMSDRK